MIGYVLLPDWERERTVAANCPELPVSASRNRSSAEAHFLAFRSTFKRPVSRFGRGLCFFLLWFKRDTTFSGWRVSLEQQRAREIFYFTIDLP